MFALCRYVSETGWCTKKKGEWQEESKIDGVIWQRIECDGSVKKREIWRCRCTISSGWGGAEGLVILVLNQKQVAPRTVEDTPIELSDEGDDLNVMACNVLSFWIFFLCFLICYTFWYWINLNNVAYWINLNKVVYSNKVSQAHEINSKNTQFYLVLISSMLHYILPKYVVSS